MTDDTLLTLPEDLAQAWEVLEQELDRAVWLTSDCSRCGSPLFTDGSKEFPQACAHPEDCTIRKLNDD